MIDYQVYFLKDLPVNEAVTINEDDSYTIFIKESLCPAKKIQAFHHALYHITHDDFYKDDVQDIEYHAHKEGVNYERINGI